MALYLLAGLTAGFGITIAGWWAFRDQSPMWGFLFLGVGIAVALLIYRGLYSNLLYQGLVRVLRREDSQEDSGGRS